MSFEAALPLPSPPKMTRRVISVTAPQDAVLQAEAARLGLSYADLIRRVIDDWRRTLPSQGSDRVA